MDIKMNKNSDVKIFRKGTTFIQGATSIPDSRVCIKSRSSKRVL